MDPLVRTEPLFKTLQDASALDAPLLLAAFGGSAGMTPAATLEYLAQQWDARPIADFDPDDLYDFTVARPNVLIDEGERVVEWPGVRLWHARPRGSDRDILLLEGREPHFRWQHLATAVGEVARALGVTEAVVLNSYSAGVPHTRRIPVTLTGDMTVFAARAGIQPNPPRYQGPATASMVLAVALREAGFKTASLNVLAPFYLAVDPNPHAIGALIEVIDRGIGTRTSVEAIEPHRAAVDQQAVAAIQASPGLALFVANLERQHDEAPDPGSAPGFRTDEVLADVEALLARHKGEPGGSGTGPTTQVR
ncbi:MAG: PAC2 family protein [Dehalococcoidia bacterium]|nr:MAG: PAC2 family protein [Dehalococcoidia bacterium]